MPQVWQSRYSRTVHPHGRGDNYPFLLCHVLSTGSPPRAWGQFFRPIHAGVYWRFTPTGVGTIWTCSAASAGVPVHPHGRGDNLWCLVCVTRRGGSPPRAWGQSNRAASARCATRFTPTGVGTITLTISSPTQETVHPHGRGDNVDDSLAAHTLLRFTPTGVGTIVAAEAAYPVMAVHPHGRGDNLVRQRAASDAHGSPPRAWGQFEITSRKCYYTRFTPTGVGTITSAQYGLTRRSVHPHGRGDNGCRRDDMRAIDGSPPRAWGQSPSPMVAPPSLRFTPTGVGTIYIDPYRKNYWSVHPHGRGDNSRATGGYSQTCGSPPRAWGQLRPYHRGRRASRFTPTGVGTIAATARCSTLRTVHPHGRGDNARASAH